MGYHKMTIEDLQSIYRRWLDNQSIRGISNVEGFDRKTIRAYLEEFERNGLQDTVFLEDEQKRLKALARLLPKTDRKRPVADEFLKHIDEIKELINRKEEPVLPKTAFLIIQSKYSISGSYESFKVFCRKLDLSSGKKPPFPRIETPAGEEIQIDYGEVGFHVDPDTGKRRKVYAFIAKLSYSRLTYVEFTYSQNQQSFAMSHVCMFEFFGGVSQYITIDNLKSGVIKADIYDPKLNRAYAELAEHYDTFINPCIKGHAKGKAKVERQVKVVRQLYRKLNYLHPGFTLKELNKEAEKWCTDDYGSRKHGTTGIEPLELFNSDERQQLKPLNPVRFEAPLWKTAKVHADQFVTLDKKRYSLPYKYRNTKVLLRHSAPFLKIYDLNHMLIRQYVITKSRIQTTDGDFPPSSEAMLMGSYPQYLIREAGAYGKTAEKLVTDILKNHAFINARKAKGMIELMSKYKEEPFLSEICRKALEKRITSPTRMKALLEDEKKQMTFEFIEIPRSLCGEGMVRNIQEYLN